MRFICGSDHEAGWEEGSLTGPHDLSNETIDVQGVKNKSGVYLLTYREKYAVHYYVGRSDGALKKRLKKHAQEEEYEAFKYKYSKSDTEAYKEECKLYHAYLDHYQELPNRVLDNKVHPGRPKGKRKLKCPRADCEE